MINARITRSSGRTSLGNDEPSSPALCRAFRLLWLPWGSPRGSNWATTEGARFINLDHAPTTGYLSTVTDAMTQTSLYARDAMGRVTSVTRADNALVSIGHDGMGNVSSVTPPEQPTHSLLPTPPVTSETVGGTSVSFGYDTDDLLTSAGALTLTPDPKNGLLKGTTLGSLTDSITYDGWGQQDTYVARHGASQLFATDFDRDLLGRITHNAETVEGDSHAYNYRYDLAGRLTDVLRDSVTVEHYEYDANGNRTRATNSAGTVGNIVVDAQDRLLTYGTKSFTYTANGELASKHDSATGGTTEYVYDALGALRQVELPDGRVIDYVIDSAGRRVGKKVDGVLQWGLLYQGALRPVAEVDAAGTVVSRFVYATGINVPDYVQRGGELYRVVTDHLGSVRMVVNASTGAVVQRMEYDAYGRVLLDEVATGWTPVPFGFAGGVYDRDTGLVRFGARDYDAEVGRWTAKDPIRFAGGDTVLYAYVGGNPMNLVDPTGLEQWTEAEVAGLLETYAFELDTARSTLAAYEMMGSRHKGGGMFDYFTVTPRDSFLVPGHGELSNADFGNFIAGFAAGYRMDPLAAFLVRIAGMAYGAGAALWNEHDRHWSKIVYGGDDERSVYWINKGMAYGVSRACPNE